MFAAGKDGWFATSATKDSLTRMRIMLVSIGSIFTRSSFQLANYSGQSEIRVTLFGSISGPII
jgi:hypothetical protein